MQQHCRYSGYISQHQLSAISSPSLTLLPTPAPQAHFYGFNLNERFLISCLQSCQSEKYLYYMRLAVPELSQHYNTTSLSSLPLITQLIQTTERLVPLLLQLYMLRLIGDIFLSNFVKIFKLVQAWDCSWKIRFFLVIFFFLLEGIGESYEVTFWFILLTSCQLNKKCVVSCYGKGVAFCRAFWRALLCSISDTLPNSVTGVSTRLQLPLISHIYFPFSCISSRILLLISREALLAMQSYHEGLAVQMCYFTFLLW